MRKTNTGMSDWFGMFPIATFEKGTCHLVPGFGNTGMVDTEDGLVLFDLPIKLYTERVFNYVRELSAKPIKYIIYSHGHFDHAFAYDRFIEEIEEKGWEMPQVIAHENVVERFKKYKMLDKYHDWINMEQFTSVKGRSKSVVSAHKTLDPTILLHGNEDSYTFKLGGITFELYHNKGETDDSIWLWVPEKKLICTGDLMISSYPNVGNPYKVQRYPKHWALAMEHMMEKDAEHLIPGHGRLIEGKENIKNVLSITAEAMHFVHDEVCKRLNEGKWFEQIYYEMLDIYPDKFKNHKILDPIYGCYRFAIHATYRLYHGWFDSGNPTDFFPAKSEDIAKEMLIINTSEQYLEHAKSLFSEGKFQLTLHIVDVIIKGASSNKNELYLEALTLKRRALNQIIKDEPSYIAGSIYGNNANRIRLEMKELRKQFKQ